MTALNRLLALLLGLAVAAVGVVAAVEVMLVLLGRPQWLLPRSQWHRSLGAAEWADTAVVSTCAILLLVGFVLLLLQLQPRRPATLPLRSDAPQRTYTLDRRGLQEHLRQQAVADGDVLGARVRAYKRKAKVVASAPPDSDRSVLRARLQERLGTAIERLELDGSYRPSVSVEQARQRAR